MAEAAAVADPTLTLVKQVDNAATGGTATATDFTLVIRDSTGTVVASGPGGVTAAVPAGTYQLSEDGGPAGYSGGPWTCDGASVSGSSVTLTDSNATCTIVNTARQSALSLRKTVINDDGGTATPADWRLTATGPTTVSVSGGDRFPVPVAVGTYTLSESGPPVTPPERGIAAANLW